MKPQLPKTLLLLSGLLLAEKLSADGDIIPMEIVVIAGLLAVIVALLYMYVLSLIVFSFLNKRKGWRKKNKANSVFLGFVFLFICMLINNSMSLSSNWITWLAASLLGAVLGYYLAADEGTTPQDAEPGNDTETL